MGENQSRVASRWFLVSYINGGTTGLSLIGFLLCCCVWREERILSHRLSVEDCRIGDSGGTNGTSDGTHKEN